MNPLPALLLPDYANSPEYVSTPSTTLPPAIQDGFILVLVAVTVAAVCFYLYSRNHRFSVEACEVDASKERVRAHGKRRGSRSRNRAHKVLTH